MKTRSLSIPVILFLLVSLISIAQADELPRYTDGGDMIHGGSPDLAKAGGDTINLMASHGDPTNGTHYDITQPDGTNWNVSNYNQPDPANHAAWCGDINIPSCGGTDPEGGYGASWHDLLEFRQVVPNPGQSSTVTVTATLIHDSEPGYDYTYLSYRYDGEPIADMQSWDAAGTAAVLNSVTYLPQEYMGGSDIAVYFRFRSDGGVPARLTTSTCTSSTVPSTRTFLRTSSTAASLTISVSGTPRFQPVWGTSPSYGRVSMTSIPVSPTRPRRLLSLMTGSWFREPAAATASTGVTAPPVTSSTPSVVWPAPTNTFFRSHAPRGFFR